MVLSIAALLQKHGIQPSAQRLAVAEYVLRTRSHPSADRVWKAAQRKLAMISRATVYNTLNLFVEKGLLRQLVLTEGKVVFDPVTTPHHHFVDEVTGRIHDVPWDAVQVTAVNPPPGFEVREYQVVLRGRKVREHRETRS